MTSTSSQRLSRAEPGTLVWASSSIRATVGVALEDGVGVHLLDDDAAVLDPPARHDLEPVEQLDRVRPAVRLDEADDEVRAARDAPVAFLEHPVRLADAGRHARGRRAAGPGRPSSPDADAREHLVRPSAGRRRRRVPGSVIARSPSRSRLSSRTLTRGWPRNPRSGCSVWRATTARTSASRHAARRRDSSHLVLGGRRADVGIEPGRRGRDQVDRDGPSPLAASRSRSTSAVIRSIRSLVRRPEVRAGRAAGVVARRVARRPRAGPRSTCRRRRPGR